MKKKVTKVLSKEYHNSSLSSQGGRTGISYMWPLSDWVFEGKLSLARRPMVLRRVRGATARKNILLVCVVVSHYESCSRF